MKANFLEEFTRLREQLHRLYQDGKYEKAIDIATQISRLVLQYEGDSHPDYALALNNLAVLYNEISDYAKAELLYRQALEIQRKVLGEDHRDYAMSLNNLAGLYRAMGDYAKAYDYYSEAAGIIYKVQGGQSPDYALVLNNLAEIYLDRRDYKGAKSLYRKILKIMRSLKGNYPFYASVLNNMASVYIIERKYSKAEDLYIEALNILRNTFGENHPDIATNLDNLGRIYYERGDYYMAEPLYTQALEIRRKVLGENHRDYAVSLKSLSLLYVATRRYEDALALQRQVAAIDDMMIIQVFSSASERQRMAFVRIIQADFYTFLSLVVKHFPQSNSTLREAFDLVLKRKAIVGEAMAVDRDSVVADIHLELKPKLRQLNSLRMEIAKTTLQGPNSSDPKDLDDYKQHLADLILKKESLETELARHSQEIRLNQILRVANHQMLANALPNETELIEFIRCPIFDFDAASVQADLSWKDAHYLAFILRSKEPERVEMIDLGEATIIDKMISAFTASVTATGKSEGEMIHKGSGLRAAIFDPLSALLGNTKKLFFAPDDELCKLPFQALPTSQDGFHYLIDSYQISYLSTGRDILRFGIDFTILHSDPIVAADPDFELGVRTDRTHQPSSVIVELVGDDVRQMHELRSTGAHFDRVKGTRTEGELIADILGVRPLLGGKC